MKIFYTKVPQLCLCLFMLPFNLSAGEKIAGQASVIDGDTIEIHGERIRLTGFDTPEGGQLCYKDGKPWRCGQTAAIALDKIIARSPVTCAISGTDRYRRILASCSVRGQDIGEWMVRNGHAVRFMDKAGHYEEAERAAADSKAGMWAGEFQHPADWRKSRRKPKSG